MKRTLRLGCIVIPALTAILAAGASSAHAQAQDEITAVPNRPTAASTAETVQRGVFEIEYGIEAADRHQNVNGLAKFGAVKNLELWFLHLPFERDGGIAGLGDCSVGFKYRIFPQKGPRPTVSVLYLASLPMATSGLGAGAVGHTLLLLVSKDFGKHHFDWNEGAQWLGRPVAGGFDRRYFSALSWSHPIAGKWVAMGEISGFSHANAATPATLSLLAGPAYNLSPRFVLDAAVSVTVRGNLPRVVFAAGLTYSFGSFYRRRHSSS